MLGNDKWCSSKQKSAGLYALYQKTQEVQHQCLCLGFPNFVEKNKICNWSFSQGTVHLKKKKTKQLIFGEWNVFYIHFLATETSPIQDTCLKRN